VLALSVKNAVSVPPIILKVPVSLATKVCTTDVFSAIEIDDVPVIVGAIPSTFWLLDAVTAECVRVSASPPVSSKVPEFRESVFAVMARPAVDESPETTV
jgi:hypothetical protein